MRCKAVGRDFDGEYEVLHCNEYRLDSLIKIAVKGVLVKVEFFIVVVTRWLLARPKFARATSS